MCKLCGGLGFTREDLPLKDPNFGRVQPCECTIKERMPLFSHLSPEECNLTWDDVIDDQNAKEAEAAIKKTLALGGGWVYIWGPPGLAKTVLLKVAVAESIRSGKLATYTNMSFIIDNLRAAFDTDYPSEQSISRLNEWATIPILAIDEFDRVKVTEWAAEKQFRLMDDRYQFAVKKERVTLMASNSSPLVFDSYLTDRITDGRFFVVEMKGESWRPGQYWDD